MAATGEPTGGEQRPNLWEELNRPRSQRPSTPPPPVPGSLPSPGPTSAAASDHVILPPPSSAGVPDGAVAPDLVRESTAGTEGSAPAGGDNNEPNTTAPAAAAIVMKRIDSQHLLLVGAVMFVVVTFFALRGLGGAPSETNAEDDADAAAVITSPDVLPAIDDTTTTPEASAPIPVEPVPEPEPAATAMGLPAALLDGPQSQVFRLYRTALGREPDRPGFAYWSDQIRLGAPIDTLADNFLDSDEFALQFEAAATNEQRMERLLTNAFGPPADEAQLGQWLERFRDLQGAQLLVAIAEADETLAATGTLP